MSRACRHPRILSGGQASPTAPGRGGVGRSSPRLSLMMLVLLRAACCGARRAGWQLHNVGGRISLKAAVRMTVMMQRVAAQFREGVAAPESAAAPGPVQRGRAPTVRRGVPTAFHAVLFWLRFTYVTPCACHESEEMDTPGHTGPLHPGRPLGALPAPTGARCPIVNPPITAYLSWQQQQQGLSHRGGAPPRPKSSRLCLAAAPQVWTEMATSRHRAPPPPLIVNPRPPSPIVVNPPCRRWLRLSLRPTMLS
jgi:hypothetical protein